MENYSKYYEDDLAPVDIEEEIEEVQEDPIVIAKVKAEQLYLREAPTKDSEPVTILKMDQELMIDQSIDPDSEWVHVCTEKGAEGYVMKFFISL